MNAVSGFSIRNILIDPPLILAPMLGVTNHAYRMICKEVGGCGLVSSEMLAGHCLVANQKATLARMDWTDDERPVCGQVYGSDPYIVADGARMIEAAGADIIEINMGCPAPNIVSSGSGGALLKDLKKVESMIAAVIGAVSVPVIVKTRTGWNDEKFTAVEVARMVEAHGGAGITVHGRTAVQKFFGEADWEPIARVKESVNIPVIGNGDVRTPEDARIMFEKTGCDGIMVGRAARVNPWIFSMIESYLTTGVRPLGPDVYTRIDVARRLARLLVAGVGEFRACNEMRGHIERFLAGYSFTGLLRPRIISLQSLEDVERVLDDAMDLCEDSINVPDSETTAA